jgi:hypothetical protein
MPENERRYLRFPLVYRLEHWCSDDQLHHPGDHRTGAEILRGRLSQWTILSLGGIQFVRVIHRIAAIVLMLVSVFHIGRAAYNLFVLKRRPTILPTLYDVKAGIQALRYNLRLGKTRPQQGRYTFRREGRILGRRVGYGGDGDHRLLLVEPDRNHACPAGGIHPGCQRSAWWRSAAGCIGDHRLAYVSRPPAQLQ